jgi:hypothetical protein
VPPAGTAPRGDDDDDDADVAAVVVVDGDTAPLPTATAALLLDLLEPHPMIFPNQVNATIRIFIWRARTR